MRELGKYSELLPNFYIFMHVLVLASHTIHSSFWSCLTQVTRPNCNNDQNILRFIMYQAYMQSIQVDYFI